MLAIVLSGGLLLASALLIIHRRLSRLPARLVAILRQERAQDDARSLWALQEATAIRVAASTAALRAHEEQVAASFRAQIADAETRARVAERRSSDAAVALSAAAELVRELRAALDTFGELRAARVASPEVAVDADRTTRATCALPRVGPGGLPSAAAEGDEADENEQTRVGRKPRAAAPAMNGGAR